MASATTWRVRLHSANQTFLLFTRRCTNEHNSSSSRTSSLLAGGASVRSNGGRLWAFFEPAGYGGARDAEDAADTAQGGALMVGAQGLFFASRIVGGGARISNEAAPAGSAAVTLFAFPGVPVPNGVACMAMAAIWGLDRFVFHHASQFILTTPVEPLPPRITLLKLFGKSQKGSLSGSIGNTTRQKRG